MLHSSYFLTSSCTDYVQWWVSISSAALKLVGSLPAVLNSNRS